LVLDEGAAFTGDLTPLSMAPDDVADPVQQSWARLRAAGATTIYPGHGPVGHLV
jgi:glyoxylase-like metal-dependent hydrolase (beta-lactamase superfamily II)